MRTLWQDLRYGFRMLRKSPGFTAVAALSLALGIGANTAIFSLIDEVAFKVLPVRNPKQLVSIRRRLAEGGSGGSFSYSTYEQLRDRNQSLAGVFALDESQLNATVDGQPEIVQGAMVSGSCFRVLGVDAALGRTFTDDDDRPAAHPVAAISYAYWKRRFGLAPSVIGKTIELKGIPFTIVGVTRAGFYGLRVDPRGPEIWAPMSLHDQLRLKDHSDVAIVGRLRPGLAATQAQAELSVLYQQILREQAGAAPGPAAQREIASQQIELAPAGRGGVRLFSSELQILMAVVGLVLLIACANVANLLLARSATRRKEIAVRLAIGAGRARLVQQLLTESVLLALAGGVLGLLLAGWGGDFLLALVSPGHPPIPPDWRILAFTAAVSLLTGVVFGLAPAFRATRVDLQAELKENARGLRAGGGRFPAGQALVVSQMVLSLLLLIGAGLFLRTVRKLHAVNLGYQHDHVLLVWTLPTLAGYDGPREIRLYQELLDRLNALPGVRAASLSRMSLLFGYWSRLVSVPGYTPRAGEIMDVSCNAIAPRFFETMGIPLLLGRDFSPADGTAAPKVAILSDAAVRRYFPGENPIGRRLHFEDSAGGGTDVEIVGVARDIQAVSVRPDPRVSARAAYIPFTQAPAVMMGQAQFKIRTTADPKLMMEAVRRQMLAVDRNLPLTDMETQDDLVDESLGHERALATLLSFFGALALLLAAIGLYGTISYAVSRRTGEIGIRMALGARNRDVLWMVLRESLRLVLIGVALGIPVALAAGRLVAALLFGVSSADPLTIALATLLLLAVAALAAWLPARRASRLDPLAALRYE